MQGNFTHIVIAVSVLLAVALAWQEYKRINKRFLWLRIITIVIAVAAIGCIVLPITYYTTIVKNSNGKTVLLTPGFDADSLKGVADSDMVTTNTAVNKLYPKARLIGSLQNLNKARQLQVYGYGLSAIELEQLDSLPVTFHAAKPPQGVINLSWNERLKSGEKLSVQGQYNNTSAKKVKLVLSGLSTGLDSVIMPANTQSSFNLSTTPKTTGKAVFSLHADTVLEGSLSVQVDAVNPLKVLMLSASPDFESKFLKNWLSEQGYSVALRSAVSKNKFNTEFINTDQFNMDRLSVSVLHKFDVLIGDLSVLNSLSEAESSALRQEIYGNGLGVIIRADTLTKTSWLQKYFPADRPSSAKEPVPAALIINGSTSKSNQLNYGAAHLIYEHGTQPLVKTRQNAILASAMLTGEGKMVFTVLNSTYSWVLNGNKDDYAALWSALMSKAARKGATVNNVAFLSMPFVNQPVQLNINQGSASALSINNLGLASAQNPSRLFEYSALYWPQNVGWQKINYSNIVDAWYAYPEKSWQTWQAANKISATNRYAAEFKNSGIVTKQIQQKIRIDVPKIYFYIMLLAACTFLWIETKFS